MGHTETSSDLFYGTGKSLAQAQSGGFKLDLSKLKTPSFDEGSPLSDVPSTYMDIAINSDLRQQEQDLLMMRRSDLALSANMMKSPRGSTAGSLLGNPIPGAPSERWKKTTSASRNSGRPTSLSMAAAESDLRARSLSSSTSELPSTSRHNLYPSHTSAQGERCFFLPFRPPLEPAVDSSAPRPQRQWWDH